MVKIYAVKCDAFVRQALLHAEPVKVQEGKNTVLNDFQVLLQLEREVATAEDEYMSLLLRDVHWASQKSCRLIFNCVDLEHLSGSGNESVNVAAGLLGNRQAPLNHALARVYGFTKQELQWALESMGIDKEHYQGTKATWISSSSSRASCRCCTPSGS